MHWKRKGNTASQINNPYLKIVNELTSYADGKDIYDHDTMTFEKCYFDMKDKPWYRRSALAGMI